MRAWRDLLLAEDGRQPLPPVPPEAAGLPVRLATALARAGHAATSGQPAGEALAAAESLAAGLAGDRLGVVARARILAVRLRCPGELGPEADTVRAVVRDLGTDRDDFLARDAALAHLAVTWSAEQPELTVHHDPEVLPGAEPVGAALVRFFELLAERPDIEADRAADLLRATWLRAADVPTTAAPT
ncbi:hypothetical protein ACFY2R_30180 [Micromonospora olivasterospora]|uniref:hypothetical protein n=1 Tax=Micromonospora olivasterospora TaxID=1880 RepID=UPI0031DB0408